jgi:hypothetical protein
MLAEWSLPTGAVHGTTECYQRRRCVFRSDRVYFEIFLIFDLYCEFPPNRNVVRLEGW